MPRFDISRLRGRSRLADAPPVGERPRVVVVGGGFAGLAAARRLRHEPVDVVIVDRNSYNQFQPLLYQVATATLNPGDVTWALRSVHDPRFGARFVLGEVSGIDKETRRLELEDGRELPYDYLVLASGVVVNYFGIEGAEEHAYPLYTRTQALKLRDEMQRMFEDAARNPQADDLRVVIVGAGATGVETAGSMAEMRNKDLPVLYPELAADGIHITLLEMAPHVLGPFSESSQAYTEEALRGRGVDLRLGTSVTEVRGDGVTIKEGEDGEEEFLPAQIVVWASGIRAPEVVGTFGLEQGKGGRIVVDEFHRSKDDERIFAVGDIAVDPDAPLPQQAQPAMQSGQHVAEVIAADVAGQEPAPFHYRDLGSLATIGRSDAVAEIAGNIKLTGLSAWMMWNGVHINGLLGGRNRVAAMVNLGTRYVFWGRNHNLIVGEPTMAGIGSDNQTH